FAVHAQTKTAWHCLTNAVPIVRCRERCLDQLDNEDKKLPPLIGHCSKGSDPSGFQIIDNVG
ncbi:MAG: hypothetical protein LUQ29_02115, partial [Methylococcaceae bacterium]|nr:hypothetical protein [Methylococcaceae bacterium]